ncbi:hypothetical protein HOY34_02445 [Xinfangfangia sp. D13-10-4-6]|uniref:hypothetical protein n=1 Tax=Pseudogemmobacter hezensis TaxID=2737662 RepID=UPI001555F6D8|nr:hypothetical protein [Pseudogemmobacter hezensis]NPD14057.1 hypothetical protein [Pseudogemmobacter hezensis]
MLTAALAAPVRSQTAGAPGDAPQPIEISQRIVALRSRCLKDSGMLMGEETALTSFGTRLPSGERLWIFEEGYLYCDGGTWLRHCDNDSCKAMFFLGQNKMTLVIRSWDFVPGDGAPLLRVWPRDGICGGQKTESCMNEYALSDGDFRPSRYEIVTPLRQFDAP